MRRLFAMIAIILSVVSVNASALTKDTRNAPTPSWEEFVEGISYLKQQIRENIDTREWLDLLTWEAAVTEAAQRAAEARRAPAPVVSTGSLSRPASGGHSDLWWQGVAQCEQGGKNDPYYGYFSFMDGSAGGKSWSEQVAMGNAVLARVNSESPAWAASCVAMGYQYSPGG